MKRRDFETSEATIVHEKLPRNAGLIVPSRFERHELLKCNLKAENAFE